MSMLQILDGPRHGPAAGGAAKKLVILVHGYGANGRDLIGLAPEWAKHAPEALFLAPDAPDPVPGVPGGRQWFPITQLDPRLLAEGLRHAAPSLERLIEREREKAGLQPKDVALMGFSQGAMLVLDIAMRRPGVCAGVLAYSGALLTPPAATGDGLPPIFLAHGDSDPTVPPEAFLAALDQLSAAGARVQWRFEPNVGHGIAPEGLEAGGRFMKAALAGEFRDWSAPKPPSSPARMDRGF